MKLTITLVITLAVALWNGVSARESVAELRRVRALGNYRHGGDNGRDHPQHHNNNNKNNHHQDTSNEVCRFYFACLILV